MITFTKTQLYLLNKLADGNCHSGSELGAELNVSRTTVWKQIKQLLALGLTIKGTPAQGYQLPAPLILLNEQTIRQQLATLGLNNPMQVHLYAALDSTNRFLKEVSSSPILQICCTETQTAGRGRFGRHWHSPFGENIYCSMRWHFDCDLAHLSGLSLVVSLAILATLSQYGIEDHLTIKWPNDLLWHDKKLSGSLVEVIAESNRCVDVIIGVGINVNSRSAFAAKLDRPYCSLWDITSRYFDRNTLLASLIYHLHHYLNVFIHQQLTPFLDPWEKVDYLRDKTITLYRPTDSITGIAKGIDKSGQLLLLDTKGIMHCLSSGDATLTPSSTISNDSGKEGYK